MKYAVTGGAGFIGSELVRELINQNHEVIVLDNLSTGDENNVHPDAKLICADISHPIPFSIRAQLADVDTVFHLAAFTKVEPSIHDPFLTHRNNVNGCFNMLEVCRFMKLRRFVLSSTSAVYGNPKKFPTPETEVPKPMSPYAISKLMSEQYCAMFSMLYNIETICLRYANVYGDNQPIEGAYANVIGVFTEQALKETPLTIIGKGTQSRDYVNVKDVVQANILASKHKEFGQADKINIGSGEAISVNSIAKFIGGKTTNLPDRIEPKKSLLDCKKANNKLGWNYSIMLKDWVKEYKKKKGLNEENKRTRKTSK